MTFALTSAGRLKLPTFIVLVVTARRGHQGKSESPSEPRPQWQATGSISLSLILVPALAGPHTLPALIHLQLPKTLLSKQKAHLKVIRKEGVDISTSVGRCCLFADPSQGRVQVLTRTAPMGILDWSLRISTRM